MFLFPKSRKLSEKIQSIVITKHKTPKGFKAISTDLAIPLLDVKERWKICESVCKLGFKKA